MNEPGFTPGPWQLCRHLQSLENDPACPCGYRGGIYGDDGNHMVCEIGSTLIKGEEGLEAPRYAREIEIANAHLIAAAPDLYEALAAFNFSEENIVCAAAYGLVVKIPLATIQRATAALARARGETP